MHGPLTSWPAKHNLFGVEVTSTCYDEAVSRVIDAAHHHEACLVDALNVHVLVLAARDQEFRRQINAFDMVVADGQPVRWSLNLLYRARLRDRVYGPELTLRLCAAAASEAGISVYFFGSTAEVLKKLVANLQARYPRLVVAGVESPPFRPLTPDEDAAIIQRINASGAGIVFVGIGCPKQESFAFEHRESIHAVQLCVGAAFDFIAGTKRIAPAWMQRRGLEWLFRFSQEPRRLWKRYVYCNSLFLMLLARELLMGRRLAVHEA